jgi:FkbM family methyltransferase
VHRLFIIDLRCARQVSQNISSVAVVKPIVINNDSVLRRLLPWVQKTRRGSWKYYDRTGIRLVINGGKIAFLDATLNFPENVGPDYATQLFWNGPDAYEADTSHVIASLLGNVRSFIDVGSNIGMYAVYAGVRHPEVLTYAFEPVPEIWQKNLAFHQANRLAVERVLNSALSDDNQPKQIFVPLYKNGLPDEQTPTLRPDSWQADSEGVRSFEIKCTTLDLFFAANELPAGPCLLKIDVENYEAAVLRGGHSFIRRHRPWMVCEILPCEEYNRETKTKSNNNRETLKLVGELEYVPFVITPNGLFRMAPPDFARPRQLKDFLLLPAETLPAEVFYLPVQSLKNVPFR